MSPVRTSTAALANVLAMPWSPERNIAIRAALGLDVAMVNREGVVIAVCPNREEARRVDRLLSRVVRTLRHKRLDGKWVVASVEEEE